ncbi:hypothetical protein EXE59_12780 [Nocardioides eburneiflavus]|uniref:Uncharacterized protein n=1 Tax=Nocardioides eburneiflavus TaxID=2518372 RepID=A0A4Z1C3B7_9ACTN|nr:hypothetical protein [Nocardioides eburneiflavus]TGN64734.1 hypothetical protein EXE59_12780 [Nocardioides eburneiflavus]
MPNEGTTALLHGTFGSARASACCLACNYFPGVILMAVVGGSALVAAAALAERSDGWQLTSIVAGTVMLAWIVGEVTRRSS